MKPINETTHGILDYATVVGFAAAPTVFGISGNAALLCYLLAAVHLTMTVLTQMRLGLFPLIPMNLHSIVELAVGPTLVLLGIFASGILGPDGWVFIPAGIAIFAVWLLSDYRSTAHTEFPLKD